MGERDEVSLAYAVVDLGEGYLVLAEFAVFCAEVLRAGVEAVDLLV